MMFSMIGRIDWVNAKGILVVEEIKGKSRRLKDAEGRGCGTAGKCRGAAISRVKGLDNGRIE